MYDLWPPPGLKKGVENKLFWSEIRSEFGEPGGTSPTRILRSTPSLPPGYIKVLVRHTNFMCHHTQVTASISNRDPLSPWTWLATYHRIAPITEKQPKKKLTKTLEWFLQGRILSHGHYQSLQICLPLCCLSHIWVDSTDEEPLIKDLRRKKQTNKALPATRKEAEITTMTGGFTDEPKTLDPFSPMIHSALNDAAHVIYKTQTIVSLNFV